MTQQINLYNAVFVPPREWLTAKSVALATAAVLVVVIVGTVVTHSHANQRAATLAAAQAERTQAQGELAAAKEAAEARKPNAALQLQVEAARTRLALRERILSATQLNLSEPGGGFSRYLTGLARHSVPGLWLTEIGIDATGANLSLGGQTIRQEAVPDYVRRLRTEPAFAGKTFAGLDMSEAPTQTLEPPAGAVSPTPTSASASTTSSGQSVPVSTEAKPLNFRLLATRSAEEETKRR